MIVKLKSVLISRKRCKMRLTGTTLLLLLIPVAAIAGGLPFAHYGILDTPSAALLRHTEVCFGGGGTVYSMEDTSGSSNMDVAVAGYLELGLFARGQIGGTYLGAGGFSGTARGLVLVETLNQPGIALGIENIIGEENYEFHADDNDSLYQYPNSQNMSIYGVVTKDLNYLISVPVCVNLGYGSGRFQQSADADDGRDNPIPGLFWSILVHPAPEAELMVEWDGRDFNLGADYRLNRHFTISACASELEHLIAGDDSTSTSGDVMQTAKFSIGFEATFGPILGRTELDPYERLRYTDDDEALRQLEEYREGAREEIRELEDSVQ